MADDTDEMTAAQRLGQLLDRGLLPAGGPAEAAERLIERLERPARVALLGLPGAGKSAVLNLLAGTVVVPEMLRLPTIVAQFGPEARMLCTLADGRTEVVPGNDLSQVLKLNPALVTLELDIPALKVISLLEVSAGAMEAEQRRAAVWASKRADIVIWCTTSYLPKEQAVWDSMPDSVKDNGFLFLTKVDLLGSRDAAAGMLERVEARAGEEFRQVLSISAKQARTATASGGVIDRDLFRDSGAAAVISTIKHRVQMARRADTDMAELLLARHVEASSIVAKRFAEPKAEPTPPPAWIAPPDEMAAPETVTAELSEPVVAPEPEILEAPAQSGVTEPEPEPVPEPETVFQPAVELAPDSAPKAEPEPELAPLSEIPTRAATEAPAQSSAPPTGSKRFSDRIKQLPMPEDAAPVEKVPLRTTWKSRAETATPPATPRPTPEPGPAPVRPKATPETPVVEEPFTLDPEPLVELPAEATPAEPVVKEIEPEVAQRETGAVRAIPTQPERPAARQLFGARKPAVPASAPVDLSGLRERPAVESSPEPIVEIEGDIAPSGPRKRFEPEPVATAKVTTPDDVKKEPVDEPSAPPSPRVAVLRDRRPEATSGERRERPRIAARAIVSVPPPPAAVQPLGPVTAAEQILLSQAVNHIIERAVHLTALIDPDDKLPVDMILDHGRETIEHVMDLFARVTSPILVRITGDLSEVLDLIMLMQLEKGHAPADDAVTLLLQVRRDLETLSAA